MSKRKQPQRLPPPVMHGDGTIDSEVVLTEVEGELGLVLWKTVRAVHLWAELPDRERSHAFDPSALARRIERIESSGAPEEIASALCRAATVLQPRARSASVSRACQDVAEWAAGRGAIGTAIEFMQAAAVAAPTDARIAHEVGKLARTRTEYTRAEMWYRQAVSRARLQKDWYEFSRSYIGLGKIFLLRGSYPQARKSLIRGLRAAKRFSIRPLAAAAYHDLMVWATEVERMTEATSFAQSALSAYGSGHRRLPALAHDYGVYLMKAGHFDAALRTFLACPHAYGSPSDQLVRAAATVRSAGAVGNDRVYATAWAQAESALDNAEAQSAAGAALLAMAQGAASAGELERALETGARAREMAIAHSEFSHQHLAESLLEAVSNAMRAKTAIREPLRPTPENVAGAVEAFEAAIRTNPGRVVSPAGANL